MQLAPLYPLLYRLLKPAFPNCLWSGGAGSPAIALTFDDGPHPRYTPELLQVLDHYQIPATFFWLGICVQRAPGLAKAIYERGHGIGVHGYTHRSFPCLKAQQLRQSLQSTQAAIAQACQTDPQQFRDVRPPNGLFTPRTLALLHQWGYRPVMWSVVPEDWQRPGVAAVKQRVLRQVGNGSLIVLHDGACGGQDVAQTTAALIPSLQQQGYRFITLNQFSGHR